MKYTIINCYILTLFILTSCVEKIKLDTEEIRSVYSGTFYSESISDNNTVDGKQTKIRLVFENDKLYNHYLVSKPAIGNFCVISLLRHNPSVFNSNDLIEFEIRKENNAISDSIFTISYDSANVESMKNDFEYLESKLKPFFDYVKNHDYELIKSMTGDLFESDSILHAYVEDFEKEIPDSVTLIKAIGYRTLINIHDKELKEITMLTQSKSGYALFNFKTMNENNEFKIVGLRF